MSAEELERRIAILAACFAVLAARRKARAPARAAAEHSLSPWALLAKLDNPSPPLARRWRGKWSWYEEEV